LIESKAIHWVEGVSLNISVGLGVILPDKPEIIEQVLTDYCSAKELQSKEKCSPYLNRRYVRF
jgi:hypothetical protein